ncbi:hypothetical protein Zmor_010409 [Zophobas morio]|uniref:Transcription factor AP-4 n=1 Tax=Zophobas morio TaxID=2755281 RepID=A0AA38IPG3_9CUCU|nr:hypothetical protein Zmor_010409 [Zophobas morio]
MKVSVNHFTRLLDSCGQDVTLKITKIALLLRVLSGGFRRFRTPKIAPVELENAAILQQTAEYIYSLEQEKTRLLSQNCQLKRLVSQHEGATNGGSGGGGGGGELPPKKRKTEIILPTLSAESSDEGLGSMSPEPVSIISVNVSNESPTELRRQLERERELRMVLQEQVRQFESQIYHQQQQQQQTQIYQVEGTEELALQLVSAECLPPVGHTQTVVCSPQNSRSPSPEPPEQRLPSVLEAAIKAEPKVEVERLPSPNPGHEDSTPSRLYASNTSRQNLETIVEAIRHLEGDHLFGDEPLTQEVPLALTKNERMNTLMEFSAAMVQQSQQSRPGVIVVKQAS